MIYLSESPPGHRAISPARPQRRQRNVYCLPRRRIPPSSATHKVFQPQTTLTRPLPLALAAAILAAVLVLAYWGIQHNAFHFDDWPNILDNPSLHMTRFGIDALIEAARGSLLPFRPVASMTFALDWWRGGGAAAPFLVTNLVLHILTAWAVLALLLRATGGTARPALVACALAALWWAAQPIHVQAVSYVVQRMTELAALFSVLCLWAWIKARSGGSLRLPWFGLSLACLALAALSKENAWITPLLVLMAEFLVLRPQGPLLRSRFDRVLLALPVLAALGALADIVLDGPLSRWALYGYGGRDFTLVERVLTQPKVVLFHVSQILWPLPGRFSLEHDAVIVRSATDWQFLVPLAVILAWCALGLRLAAIPRRRLVAFFMLWVPVTLLIESTVVPLELVFEHRMYLPAVGFAGLLAIGLHHAFETGGSRPLTLGAAALVAAHTLFALAATHHRIPQWRSEAALYEQATRVAPNSHRAWNHLGIALLGQRRGESVPPERYARALQAFGRAIELAPDYPAPWTNRGVARYMQGDVAGALEDLRKAISLSPREAAAQHYLAEIYTGLGRFPEARLARKRACALGVAADCNQ